MFIFVVLALYRLFKAVALLPHWWQRKPVALVDQPNVGAGLCERQAAARRD